MGFTACKYYSWKLYEIKSIFQFIWAAFPICRVDMIYTDFKIELIRRI
jgi:hypothetical protein